MRDDGLSQNMSKKLPGQQMREKSVLHEVPSTIPSNEENVWNEFVSSYRILMDGRAYGCAIVYGWWGHAGTPFTIGEI